MINPARRDGRSMSFRSTEHGQPGADSARIQRRLGHQDCGARDEYRRDLGIKIGRNLYQLPGGGIEDTAPIAFIAWHPHVHPGRLARP